MLKLYKFRVQIANLLLVSSLVVLTPAFYIYNFVSLLSNFFRIEQQKWVSQKFLKSLQD